jgi:hypothetical protein
MKHLNDGSTKLENEDPRYAYPFKPHLTFTDLFNRIKRTHPKITHTTLARHLNKMKEQHTVIRYSSGRSRLARDNQVFYRLNPETSGEQEPLDTKRNRQRYYQKYYPLLSWKKRLGKVVRTYMITSICNLVIEKLITRDGSIIFNYGTVIANVLPGYINRPICYMAPTFSYSMFLATQATFQHIL